MYLIVSDSAASSLTFGLGEVDSEVGLEASAALHAAPGLCPVRPVDDALEGLLGVHPDGHGAADAAGFDRGLEAFDCIVLFLGKTVLKKKQNCKILTFASGFACKFLLYAK